MRKRLAIVLLGITCACCLGLTACDGGDRLDGETMSVTDVTAQEREAIASAMEENIAAFEEGKQGMVDALVEDDELASLFELTGIDATAYADAMGSAMTMETGTIQVGDEGDNATVELIMHSPDYSALNKMVSEAIEEATDDLDMSKLDEDEAYASFGQAIMSTIQSDIPMADETFIVEYKKTDGAWSIQNRDELTQAIERVYAHAE